MGDCDAAIRLLIDAAKRAPGLAEGLARRYDPEGFAPTPCFPQAKPDSAIVWYQSAAEQDIPAAQRRYGELLLGEATSGPIYRDAVDWLRKAASAGDEAAARRLDALGER
jgi:TPR repeat protein